MKNKKHYSVDLETLGTSYNSYILSIGVAEFNIVSGEITNEFHKRTLCPNEFNIDYSTVMWWLDQSLEARDSITKFEKDVSIFEALANLNNFIVKNSLVWGNGATFDISILEHAYSIECDKPPWEHWNVRDMRTIIDLATSIKGFNKKDYKFEGIKHNALADAKHQAMLMHKAYALLELPF